MPLYLVNMQQICHQARDTKSGDDKPQSGLEIRIQGTVFIIGRDTFLTKDFTGLNTMS